jgi:hydroxymethylbilane synthase
VLRLGTRGSQLALWQARAVAAGIAAHDGPRCEIIVVRTSGDELQDAPLAQVGGKRLFVKEIEDALLRNEIDLAVHSSKDMPALLPAGLSIGAVLPREDPRDAVVLPLARARQVSTIEELVGLLGEAPTFGTSSVRRIAQLSGLFSRARFSPIRGNLDTRLRKLDAGQHSALVLATAGLRRLGFGERISLALPVSACVPAPGQGIVAIEIREEDWGLRQIVETVDDRRSRVALTAERALVEALGAGCQTPVGALATPVDPDTLDLVAVVVTTDGTRVVRASGRASMADATDLGTAVAAQLTEQGAGDILADAKRAPGAVAGIQP